MYLACFYDWLCVIFSFPSQKVYMNCEEYRQDGFVVDGLYWIDPDGPGLEDAFYVHCTMATGRSVLFA